LGLLGIPHEVFRLVNLQYFSVNRNQLSILTFEIGDLKRLRDLNLSDNHLSSLPPEIGQLKRLERLFLSGNWLSSLPPELADVAPLRVLSLLRNPLPDPYRSLVSSRPTLTARNVLSLLREQETIQSTVDEDQSPEIPDPGPGSTFVPTQQGYELEPQGLEGHERDDQVQRSLHARLRRRVERLQGAMGRIGNTHPTLAAEFADYAMFVGPDLDELDVASLWSAGSGLSEFVRALDAQDLGRTITEPLEPEPLGELRALMRDHTAFVLGFTAGRELMARAEALRDAERPLEVIKATTLAILRPMLETKHLLAERAQHLVQSLSRALTEIDTQALSLLASGSETGRNGLIAFGRALHPLLILAGSVDVVLMVSGNAQADTLRTTISYLRDNADAIAAFAASDPQLSTWLTWLLGRSHDLLRDMGDAL
jgi:hypothetical protein